MTNAMHHLGNVLYMLAELHEDDRCDAFEAALAFYNRENPDMQVVPQEGFSTRLEQRGPLDRVLDQLAKKPA